MKRILAPDFIWSNQAAFETSKTMVIAGMFRLVNGPGHRVEGLALALGWPSDHVVNAYNPGRADVAEMLIPEKRG